MKRIHGVVVLTFMTYLFHLPLVMDGPSCYFSSKLANEQANLSIRFFGIAGKVGLYVLKIRYPSVINSGFTCL